MSKEFKAGDLVYCPNKSQKVHTLQCREEAHYPLVIYFDDDADAAINYQTFTFDGLSMEGDKTPDIIHATEENHALLEKLYGMKFEAPPVKPTSKDIIQALLKSGHSYVPCYVSSGIEAPNGGSYLDFIVCVHNDGRFYNQLGGGWKYATPFDPKTGEPITEMPE